MASLSSLESGLNPRLVAQAAQSYQGALLKALDEKEKKIDKQLAQLETMDEDDFERLREKRKQQMVKHQEERKKNERNGHGRYMELSDQKEFFSAGQASKQVVCHFYRGATWRCQIVDRHLGDLAPAHLETRFVKIDAEKSPYLVEKLGIVMLPSILCIKDGKIAHTVVGFDEFGGTDDFSSDVLAYVLSQHEVLTFDGPAPIEADEDSGMVVPSGVNRIDMRRGAAGAGSIREGHQEREQGDDDDDDDFDRYMDGFEEDCTVDEPAG